MYWPITVFSHLQCPTLLPGQISANALWDALRQRSMKILEEMETETSQVRFKQKKMRNLEHVLFTIAYTIKQTAR